MVFLSEVVKKLRLLETNLNRHLFNAELEGGGSVMVDFTVVSQKEGPIFKSLATRGPLSVAFACFPCVCVGSLKILQLFSTEGRCRCMLASNDCLFLCVGPVVAWPPLQEVPCLSSYGWMELFEWEKGIDRKVLFWSFFSFNLTS